MPICTELNTPAGPIDNFMVTPSGLPVLVECKLWRNPEARREVVSQILDYAKELSRWSSSEFNDALTANLRRGRFLLLIVGDGIREGVEAIAEYLQLHAGLHFSLGLVELPIYVMPNGDRLVAPRALARTALVTRNVVAVPDGRAAPISVGLVTLPVAKRKTFALIPIFCGVRLTMQLLVQPFGVESDCSATVALARRRPVSSCHFGGSSSSR